MKNLEVITQKEEKNERLELENLIPILHKYIDRICLLLSDWTNDYSFSEEPELKAAIAHFKGESKESHSIQSFKWFWEYKRIRDLVDMAFDYALDARELIEQESDM